MEVGEHWAYGTSDTPWYFIEARVLRIDNNQISVAFLDDEGIESWRRKVPRRFLRARWDDRWDYLREARIRRADSNAEDDAADLVFERYIPWEVAEISSHVRFEVTIHEPDQLSAITAMSRSELSRPHLDFFAVARSAAANHSDDLLRYIDTEERADRHEAVTAAMNSNDQWWYMAAEERLEQVALNVGRLTQRRNSVLRTWVGKAAVDRAAENDRLRFELLNARLLARLAIDGLREAARTKRAERLAVQLDSRLESLHDLSPDENPTTPYNSNMS
jgi:hypothetical protein